MTNVLFEIKLLQVFVSIVFFLQMITVITGRFSTALRLEEMKEFFKKNPEAGAGEQYRKIALETVESNIRFRQSHSKEIHNWLQNNSGI